MEGRGKFPEEREETPLLVLPLLVREGWVRVSAGARLGCVRVSGREGRVLGASWVAIRWLGLALGRMACLIRGTCGPPWPCWAPWPW